MNQHLIIWAYHSMSHKILEYKNEIVECGDISEYIRRNSGENLTRNGYRVLINSIRL